MSNVYRYDRRHFRRDRQGHESCTGTEINATIMFDRSCSDEKLLAHQREGG